MTIDNLCMGCMNILDDDEETCHLCGYKKGEKNTADKLPPRFILMNRYVVGKLLFDSCESNVYIGFDTAEKTAVEIKEYFPEGVAKRNPDRTVSAEEGKEFTFNDGLMAFIEQSKKLIGLELPALSKTLAVFEENGSVYAVSEKTEGEKLKNYVEKAGGTLPWEQARPLFLPLIDTLITLNEADIIHGGISPESVIVTADGTLHIRNLLINRVRSVNTEMTAQIYGGYAALEQYESEGLPLGTYTDVYGISATLFKTLIGILPPDATERLKNDTLSIPAHFAEELPRQVLVAMANGLQVKAENRTATVEKFRDELVYGETRENLKKAAKKKAEEDIKSGKAVIIDDEEEFTEESGKSGVKTWLIAVLCTVGVFAVIAAILVFVVFKSQIFGKKQVASSSSEDSMPSVASIGEYESSAVNPTVNYTVPNVVGKFFSEIGDQEEYKHFKFTIAGKTYSDTVEKGVICIQSVPAASTVHEETTIAVTISLGAKEFKLSDVTGFTEAEAKIELLKQGILFRNIEVIEKFDSAGKPQVVLEQTPKKGETVTAETAVKIYVNSYKGEEETSSRQTSSDDTESN